MSPLAAVFNIAIIVAIVGIVVYWVRRFAVFRGYKDIQGDVLRVAALLNTQPVREGKDVVVAGYLGWLPTIIHFSKELDTPGLYVQMRVPATFNFTAMPKSSGLPGEGRVLMRTGSTLLDKRFNTRSDHPLEVRMLLGTNDAMQALEQLCCSSQTGVSVKGQTLELSEMMVPAFTANHVLDHLHAMNLLASRIRDMPGATSIRLQRLPPAGSGWTIRIAALTRRVEDHARRRSDRVKTHAVPDHGRVAKLMLQEGYGFVQMSDGQEVYFHKNAAGDSFDKLAVGDEVRVIVQDKEGEKGPQASLVTPIGKHHLQDGGKR